MPDAVKDYLTSQWWAVAECVDAYEGQCGTEFPDLRKFVARPVRSRAARGDRRIGEDRDGTAAGTPEPRSKSKTTCATIRSWPIRRCRSQIWWVMKWPSGSGTDNHRRPMNC